MLHLRRLSHQTRLNAKSRLICIFDAIPFWLYSMAIKWQHILAAQWFWCMMSQIGPVMWPFEAQSRQSKPLGLACAACFEQLAGVFASCGAAGYRYCHTIVKRNRWFLSRWYPIRCILQWYLYHRVTNTAFYITVVSKASTKDFPFIIKPPNTQPVAHADLYYVSVHRMNSIIGLRLSQLCIIQSYVVQLLT